MKIKISEGRKIMFAALLTFALAICAAAQSVVYKQGDTVQTPDGRTGVIESFKNQEMAKVKFGENDSRYFMLKDLQIVAPKRTTPLENFRVGDMVIDLEKRRNLEPMQQLQIDSISGDSAIVRYGNGKYNVYTTKLENLVSLKTWERTQNEENRQKILRADFADEAKPFMRTVEILANTYDPKFMERGDSFTGSAADHQAWLKDMEALAAICRKYPNLTNPQYSSSYGSDAISHSPIDICKLAEQRTSVVQRTKNKLGDKSATQEIGSWSMKLDEAMQNSEGLIDDELQLLLYERAAWEQMYLKNLKKKYTERGAVMSPEVFKPLDEYAAAKKEKIESDAAQREWEKPNFTDAAMEALAKRRFAVDFPGIQVLKTGMTFTTWKEMDKTSLIGSDSTWKYYKTTPGAYRYKLGLALIKMPNRPMWQIRGFQLTQHKAGGGFGAAKASVAEAGIFVKCP